jgi:hypothetical protein
MIHKSFKKERNSIKQRFIERRKLLKPFIKLYGNPVLVHAIDNKTIFKRILEEGKLKLPKTHSFPKKTPFMEQILRIDNGIYYSLGFVYLTAYDWKYNLIFDINYLKNLVYYKNSVNYQCYKAVVNYWSKNDKDYLEKLANTNKQCREVVDKYYNTEYNGKKRVLFDFWKIEKYVFDFINAYPNKKEIKNIIKKVEQSFIKSFPSSLRDAKKSYLTERTPEIVGLKENNLLKNKYFLGFYINGKIPKDIMAILKKKYSDKILFNGTKIRNISGL